MGVFIRRTTGMVVLAVTLALAAAGGAQAAWSGVDGLGTGRYNHTATVLQDGRVLVAGGYDNKPLATARIYDPAAGAWSDAASMKVARQGQAAVRLQSGKVLVAGGYAADESADSPSGYTRTAEVYDPESNTWSRTAHDMSTGRFQPTMTLLEDGRVLVAGGSGDIVDGDGIRGAVALSSAEIYDPATDSWSDAAPMSAAREGHDATLLPSGKVLVAGGYADGKGELASAELYDPEADSWSATGDLAQARDAATMTTLPNDDVLVAGGDGGEGHALASAEIYDASAGEWHGAANLAGPRQSAAATLMKDGSVLVTGGEDARLGTVLSTAERYDPDTDQWSDAGAMTVARKQHTLTALADGRVLVVGGNEGGFDVGIAGVDRFGPVGTTLSATAFGSHKVGVASDAATSVLTNTGTAPLLVGAITVTGGGAHDYEVASESCSEAPVAPGATCEIGVVFTPAAAGARNATLTVADNSAAGTSTAALTGSGASDAPADGQAPAATPPAATAPAPAASDPAAGHGSGKVVVAGTKAGSPTAAAKATCSVKSARRNGRTRSTVTCRVTWPAGKGALDARLMRGTKALVRGSATLNQGRAGLTLKASGRLRAGRYTVVVAQHGGPVVLRQAVRVG
jgi:N-acetylneuraminic acid mutarotase